LLVQRELRPRDYTSCQCHADSLVFTLLLLVYKVYTRQLSDKQTDTVECWC